MGEGGRPVPSGIVVDDVNGATGIVVELVDQPERGDVELVARSLDAF